jgi:exonuclease VII large subunit
VLYLKKQGMLPIDKDVDAALGPYGQAYDIGKRPIPLTDPSAVADALSGGNIDANLVAIVRGGGTMPALSDRQVVDAVAYHMPVPIVSAVGHDVDQPLIQEVVHWAFATPTALGTWLADRAKGAIHAREAMALDQTRALEAMQRQLTDLTEVVTAAKLAETAAREAETQAREETGALRRDLQQSESRRRRVKALLVVTVIILAVMVLWRIW